MASIKLSILIPTYNYEAGINKILDSIDCIKEDIRDLIEIIISDDSQYEIIQRNRTEYLKKSFKNFRYIHNIDSLGAIDNWNKLISIAKGDYIWLLHHDEFWQKEKNIIEYIFEVINLENPNILILPITKSKSKNFQNFKIHISNKHKTFERIIRKFINNPKLLIKTNLIGPPSALIYKTNSLNFDSNLKYLVDIDFYMKLFTFYKFRNIVLGSENYNLLSSQNNNKSITNSLRKEIRSLKKEEEIYLFKKYKVKYNFHENIASLYSYFILKVYSLITSKIIIKINE